MTVAQITPQNSYIGSGSANSFPFAFSVFLQTEILVTVENTNTDIISNLSLGTDYTVQGLNPTGSPASPGSITLINAGQAWLTAGGNLNTGFTLTITANFPYSQPFSIRNQGDLDRAYLENALDNLEYQIQQLVLAISQISPSGGGGGGGGGGPATSLIITDLFNGHTYSVISENGDIGLQQVS